MRKFPTGQRVYWYDPANQTSGEYKVLDTYEERNKEYTEEDVTDFDDRMILIGNDTADLGGCQKDILGLFLCKKALDILLTAEVQLFMGTGDDIGVALTLQFAHDGAAHHAAMTGDINFSILFHHDCYLLLMLLMKLFDNALFEIFSQIGLDMLLGALYGDLLHVMIDHDLDKLCKGGLGGVPAQLTLGLAGVTPQVDNIGGTVEIGADLDDDLACSLVDAFFVHALAHKFQLNADIVEGQLSLGK